jgi:phosphopantothenoylcysteine decarboxylase/phosphopantothenate--cysteine ligase
MYDSQILQENIEKLQDCGAYCEFIGPFIEEGKVKIVANEDIVAAVIRRLWKNDLVGKRVLVVAGSTAEPLDDFRVLTNRSTGKMGIELAKCAYERGGDVTLWYGASPKEPPGYINTERFRTVDDLFSKMAFLDNHVTIVCAAIADYSPEKQHGKIPSGQKELSITLKPTLKVLGSIRDADQRTYLVGFKAEYDTTEPELVEKAYSRLESLGLSMIVANDLKQVSEDENHVHIIRSNRERTDVEGDKSKIAITIFDEIVEDLAARDTVMMSKD